MYNASSDHFTSSCIVLYSDGRKRHYTSGRTKSFSGVCSLKTAIVIQIIVRTSVIKIIVRMSVIPPILEPSQSPTKRNINTVSLLSVYSWQPLLYCKTNTLLGTHANIEPPIFERRSLQLNFLEIGQKTHS